MSEPREVGRPQGEPWPEPWPGDDPEAVAAAPPRATTTIEEWPPAMEPQEPPVRIEALAEAQTHRGAHEDDKNNFGAIVRYRRWARARRAWCDYTCDYTGRL